MTELAAGTRVALEKKVRGVLELRFGTLIEPRLLDLVAKQSVESVELELAGIDRNAYERGRLEVALGANPSGESPEPLESTRRFYLHRFHENSPHSAGGGTGIVAVGVEYPDKTVALRWLTGGGSTAVWPNIELVRATHCHEDSPTELNWVD